MSIQRSFEALDLQLERCPSDKAVGYLEDGKWQFYSSEDCQQQVLHYAGFITKLGLKRGDFMAIMPGMVLPEWLFLDLAAQNLGVIVLSINVTASPQQLQYILEESKVKFVFVLDVAAIQAQIQALPSDIRWISLTKTSNTSQDLKSQLAQSQPITSIALEEHRALVQPSDVATVIYTSGTTGTPKGVMLTHANMAFNINVLLPLVPIQNGDPVVTFLPYSHIFERNTIFIYLAYGMQIHMIGDRSNFAESLITVRPKFFTTVPRILEKIYDQVIAYQASQKWFNRQWLRWAIKTGSSIRTNPWVKFQKWMVRVLIFGKFRRQFGGRLEAIVVGAASLQPKLGHFFCSCWD